jgi:hypothetical protein
MHPTQKEVIAVFNSELGEQCDELYSTSDGSIFIRYNEAIAHSKGELDEDTQPLEDKSIYIWFNEWSGNDPEPQMRYLDVTNPTPTKEQCHNALDTAIALLEKEHPELNEEHSTGWDMIQTLLYIRKTYYPKQFDF